MTGINSPGSSSNHPPRSPTPIRLPPTTPLIASPPQFYHTPTQNPPPLPTRPQQRLGSSRTFYHAATPPPSYPRSETSPFREPMLVADDPIASDHTLPSLVPADAGPYHEAGGYHPGIDPSDWAGAGGPTWSNAQPAWNPLSSLSKEWPQDTFDASAYMPSYGANIIDIDGRDDEEERAWWNAAMRASRLRPGPGILPPMLTDELHNPEHSLLSVSVTPPDIKMPSRPELSTSNSYASTSGSGSSSASQPSASTPLPPSQSQPPPSHTPPTPDEVRTAVPHPHAYYCRTHNGWVLVIWKSSSILPHLARSFQDRMMDKLPLPDQARRRKTRSCLGERDEPFGLSNKTHHFHVYKKAVDARKLNPPFCRSEWDRAGKIKEKRRRAMSLEEVDLTLDIETGLPKFQEESEGGDGREEAEEGDLLDLYVCCQCQVYCIASAVVPGVIPLKYLDELTRDKETHPPPGKTGQMAVVAAWETILRIIENKLWKGENRALPIHSTAFHAKVGWSPTSEKIFQSMGFSAKTMHGDDTRLLLEAPATDPSTPEGKQGRAKLLRAWVELNAWLTEYSRMNAKNLVGFSLHKLWVKVEYVRENYQRGLGAHPEQIPRGNLPDVLRSYQPIEKAWIGLGLTPVTYSWDLLAFAYLAQCRCDPANTMDYFTHFYNIVGAMHELGTPIPQDLQTLVMDERSRNRFTYDDFVNATALLGFGKFGVLSLDFDEEIEDDFIANAWRDAVRRAWRDPENGSELVRVANDSFRILAEARGSLKLRQIWEAGSTSSVAPERAYDVLEVPKDVDEYMLLTVFGLRLQEQPSQSEKWREALSIVAEVRDSERLRQFLVTGHDPGDLVAPTPPDLPRGLNQLGNTCYLNSLLQYFYTIKELREAVAPMAHIDHKSLDDDKLTDDDLKRHRVGGRLVTRREILRSKKFISHLADLFVQMEYCEASAITPNMELAKLALVTSRDEEEDEVDKGGTDSSNDTDATLVEDGPSRFPVSDVSLVAQASAPPLDLKEGDLGSPMIDSPTEKEDYVMISQAMSRGGSESPPPLEEAGPSARLRIDGDGDIVMNDIRTVAGPLQKPPPLPTRKATVSDSVMMFGRQHDVAECMDNCMFQIETAMLKFDEMSDSQNGKTSVVKRLFYGKMRQRVTVADPNDPSRLTVHEKEDIFSHLPVNVAEDGGDLHDGLGRYFDDVVEFEGKKAKMEVSLVDMPPLLQIQLQRVQFNRETLQPYKSQAYVKFGETLFMDRFLDSASPAKKSRSKAVQADLNACRERMQVLTQGSHAPFDLSLEHTLEFLSQEELIPPSEGRAELLHQLSGEPALVKAELDELRTRAVQLKEELESIWQGCEDATYELTSVFVHRGSSPSYNDSDVTVVSKEEVLSDTTGQTANPYLLVYARKGSEVVDTVKRFDPTMSIEDVDA